MKDPNRKPSDPKRCCYCGTALAITASGCVQNGIVGTVWCAVCGYRVNAGHDSDHGMATAAALRKYWRKLHEVFPNFDDPEPSRIPGDALYEVPEQHRVQVTVSNDPNDDPLRGSYRR